MQQAAQQHTVRLSCLGFDSLQHRIRINAEGKAKVVAAAWGEELIQLFATLAI